MLQNTTDNSNSNSNQTVGEQGANILNAATRADEMGLAREINNLFPHPYLNALGAILIFILLGKVIDWVVTGVVSRLVQRTKTDIDDRVLEILHRPIFLTVVLMGLSLATHLLMLPDRVTVITVDIIKTLVVFVWFNFSLRLLQVILEQMERHEERFKFVTSTTMPLIKNSVTLVLAAAAVYAVFLIWDINITAWLASAGIVGLAVSFAAKDTLSNVFGGVTIFADKPFKVGDYIILGTGERGMITMIGVRSTRILTRDDVEITVPNSILATTTVINESGGPHEKFRIRLKVGVAYGSDIDKVEEVLLKAANDHKEVCADPFARVRFRAFGNSSLDYELLCWVNRPVLQGLVLHELHREVYKAFNREGIEIPFPQQDIYIKQVSGNAGSDGDA
ncbi:MAG: mechanosensitive ion channel family protein [Acidobacteria bacterium]|nr:MAG: mechanosensitive ion channel family protein [Acidobacteriota bacterium]REK01588.1 MAG: mechanosensitive ion channel family protein [Acidobacteriota bacterium]REK14544.1 MAG: mechanosensitive ion channel family protein [Acidobacteriota bacterium]REK45259.1 MAG: mechanosensitive ion channel family protein [Acidobacteriota bacterium]